MGRRRIVGLLVAVLMATMATCASGAEPRPRSAASQLSPPAEASAAIVLPDDDAPEIAAPLAATPIPAVPAVLSSTGIALPVLGREGDAWKVSTPCGREATVTSATPLPTGPVVLDPGHGGYDPGAVGPNGLYESDVNLSVSKHAAAALERAGFVTVMTRNGDHGMNLVNRAKLAVDLKAKAFVSVHHNAASWDPSAIPGSEMYHQEKNAESKRLAGLIYEEIVAALRVYDVPWVTSGAGVTWRTKANGDDWYAMVNQPRGVNATLAELAFISNPAEADLLADPEVQRVEGEAVARGIIRFLTTGEAGIRLRRGRPDATSSEERRSSHRWGWRVGRLRRPRALAPAWSRRLTLGLVLAVAAVVSQVQAQSPGSVAAAPTPASTVAVTEAPATTAAFTTTTTEPPTTTSSSTTSTSTSTTTTTIPLAPAPVGFVDSVRSALADPRFESATVGLSVWIEGSGTVLNHNADTNLRPGSNEKLLVAWGALGALGPAATFVTDVRADGGVDGSTLRGHLVLVGAGDPSLRSTGPHSLDRLAALVRAAGITEVTGDLVADESHFDSERKAPGWTERHVPNFVGPVSALAVDGNVWRTDPEYLVNPAVGNLGAFRAALAARGVTVAGGERAGTAPDPTATVARVRSSPVADLVGTMMTNSDNFYAEMLLKGVGQSVWGRGTFANGMGVVHQLAGEAGVRLSGRAADGSGLSRDNSRRPQEWADLLVAARSQPWFDQLVGALPLGGRSGTLLNRFRGTPAEANVRAKTGSVQQTRALSGYLTTAGGRPVVFSMIVNSNPLPAEVIGAMDNVISTMAASRG